MLNVDVFALRYNQHKQRKAFSKFSRRHYEYMSLSSKDLLEYVVMLMTLILVINA